MNDEPEPRLFSDAGLSVLNSMEFDPAARGNLELLSGGLLWPDEFPQLGSSAWSTIAPGSLYRFLLFSRALITLHPEQSQTYELWEQVARYAPNWPGLRPERRGDKALRRLRAALRHQKKCFADFNLNAETDEQSSQSGSDNMR